MFRVKTILQSLIAAAALVATSALSPLYAADKDEHGHDATAKGGMSAGSKEMHEMMMSGMKEMQSMKPTGNVDQDFAMMMRHHHMQGVRMAEYELKHGKDAKMREMAQKIVDSQKKEIAEFDDWLKTKPQGPAKK